jgi:hypothetical protein
MATDRADADSSSNPSTDIGLTVDRYICLYAYCNASFHRPYDLDRHLKKHFPLAGQIYGCPADGCPYKGAYGFQRYDKFMEHCRKSHRIYVQGLRQRPCVIPNPSQRLPPAGLIQWSPYNGGNGHTIMPSLDLGDRSLWRGLCRHWPTHKSSLCCESFHPTLNLIPD